MRTAIATQLQQFGVKQPIELHETLLIRNGLFCGRKFQSAGHLVVWFIEEDEIKFFSPCGELLKSVSAIECLALLQPTNQSIRRAA
jgi:hypothetical protein